MAKLRSRVSDAVKDKRLLIERQEHMAEREKDKSELYDDGYEENFVLDPSILTVQDLKLTLIIPAIHFIAEVVFSVSSDMLSSQSDASDSKPLPYYKAIPILSIDLGAIEGTVKAKNNPWDVVFSLSFQSLKIIDIESKRKSKLRKQDNISPLILQKSCTDPIVSVPGAQATLSITQCSSIGRNIDGVLNVSCFEWSAELSVLYLKFYFRPRSFQLPSLNGTSLVWKAYRVLEHLWIPKFPLGLGSTIISLGNHTGTEVTFF